MLGNVFKGTDEAEDAKRKPPSADQIPASGIHLRRRAGQPLGTVVRVAVRRMNHTHASGHPATITARAWTYALRIHSCRYMHDGGLPAMPTTHVTNQKPPPPVGGGGGDQFHSCTWSKSEIGSAASSCGGYPMVHVAKEGSADSGLCNTAPWERDVDTVGVC